ACLLPRADEKTSHGADSGARGTRRRGGRRASARGSSGCAGAVTQPAPPRCPVRASFADAKTTSFPSEKVRAGSQNRRCEYHYQVALIPDSPFLTERRRFESGVAAGRNQTADVMTSVQSPTKLLMA